MILCTVVVRLWCLLSQVGDLVSVIDMPHKSESQWWRGKKGLEVNTHHSTVYNQLISFHAVIKCFNMACGHERANAILIAAWYSRGPLKLIN